MPRQSLTVLLTRLAIGLLLGGLWLTAPSNAQANWSSMTDLGGHVCHVTTDKDLSTDIAALSQADFSCAGAPRGYQNRWLWLQIDHHSLVDLPAPWELLIDQTRFHQLRVIVAYADGHVERHALRSGAADDYWTVGSYFRFSIERRDVPVTKIAIGFERLVHYPAMRKLRAVPADDFAKLQDLWMLLAGVFLGVTVASLAYNIFLFAGLRYSFQFYYCLWTASILAYAACWSAIALYLWPGLAGTWLVRLDYLTACAAVGFSGFFFVTLMEPGTLPRWTSLAIQTVSFAVLTISVPATFDQFGVAGKVGFSLNFMMLAETVLILTGIVAAKRRQSRVVNFYVIAWVAPFLALCARLLRNFGLVAHNDFIDAAVLVSAAIEAVLLSIAVADRLRSLRTERDVAHAEREEMRRLAETDQLTGLYNRRGFVARAQIILAQANERKVAGLIVLDLDEFKSINDGYGHDVGDLVLERIAKAIAAISRGVGTAARLGGEEFGVALPLIGRDALFAFAERLRQAIAATSFGDLLDDRQITASLGVVDTATLPNAGFEKLYRAADQALYRAKQAGRNRVAAHLPEIETSQSVVAFAR